MRTEGAREFAGQVDAGAASVARLDASSRAAGRNLARAGAKLQRFGDQAGSAGRKMTRTVTTPMALAGGAAVKLAVDFDKGMRNVNSLAQLPEKSLKKLSNQVLALAGPTAQAPEELAAGLYDLISTGYSAADSMKILKVGALAGTAGLTDASTATSAVVSSLQAYHKGAGGAQAVSDTLFKIVDVGRISFEQLNAELGQVLAPANAIGVPLNQLGAAMATLTKGGYSAGDAATGMRNVFEQLLKPTPKLHKQLEAMGVKSGPEAIKKFGSLQAVLVQLRKQVHGNVPEFAKLFSSQQATSAAFALTGKNAEGAAKDLDAVTKSSGATAKALDQQTKSTAFKWQRLVARLKADAIKVGDTVLPVLDDIIGKVDKLVDAFTKLPKPVRNAAAYIAIGLAALGPLLVAGGAVAKGAGSLAKLFGKGKGGKGAGALAGKAGVVPVWVTNPGFGGDLPGGKKGKGGKGGKVGKVLKKVGGPGATALRALGGGSAGMGAGLALSATAMVAGIVGLARHGHKRGVTAKTKGPGSNAAGYDARRANPMNGPTDLISASRPASQRAGSTVKPTLWAPQLKITRGEIDRAAAKAALDAGKAAVKWSDNRPVHVVLNVDGRKIAEQVQRQAKKDKARR
jgi:TP901 family phage tail tape measure protein